MVDSIHQANRIGVIAPPGPLRKNGRHRQSRKDSREERGPESQTTEEEVRADQPDIDQGAAAGRSEIATSSDNQNNRQTGRRINVRI